MKNLIIILLCLIFSTLHSQHTVGLVEYSNANSEGYVLFAPMTGKKSYLIDKCGKQINSWTSTYKPGLAAYLLEDGSLLRAGDLNNPNFNAGGSGGVIEKFDWNGTITWSYVISDSGQCQHHDIRSLPNGNVLAIVWDSHLRADVIQNGKDSSYSNATLWSEKIIEIQPQGATGGIIVWEWRLWDHLVQDFDASKNNFGTVNIHPELVDINYFNGPPTSADWIHLNSVDYNADLDQVMISSHNMDELWIIDHSTTTAEARTHSGGHSTHGGDILYRWGNPQTYRQGTNSDQIFYGQHHANWIPSGYPNAGDILVFNNGLNRPVGLYSTVDRFTSPVDMNGNYSPNPGAALLPVNVNWRYTATPSTALNAGNISGAYALLNGGFMIADGPHGEFFEIDSSDTTVWKYINPVTTTGIISQGTVASSNTAFRCNFYYPDYPAFTGRTLTPGVEVELNPIVSLCPLTGVPNSDFGNSFQLYPNPSSEKVNIVIPDSWKGNSSSVIRVFNYSGRSIREIDCTSTGKSNIEINVSDLNEGAYFLEIQNSGEAKFLKMIVNRHF